VAELQMLRQLPLQRLLSLLLSCLKLAGTSVWEQQQQQQQNWLPLRLSTQTAAACVTACIKLQWVLLRRLTAAFGSSSSSTASAAAAAYTASLQEQQLLAVVVARGARMIAECILAAAAAGAAGSDSRGSADGSSSSSSSSNHERSSDNSSSRQALLQMLTDNTDKVRQVLETCWSSLSWLRSFLSALQMPGMDAAAGAAVLQPLLQQQEELQQEAWAVAKLLPDEEQDAIDAENTSSSISSSRIAECAQLRSEVAGQLPRLAERLIVVADAVCAELPVPLCCNNPSCRSFGCVSELQLVGGKGSICSRCR
jgi:hypothetical protein